MDLTPEAADRLIPRWHLGDAQYVYVGDEVAVLSPRTMHTRDAYGRIVGLDPDGSGLPVVLILSGEQPGTIQAPIPLSDIIGKRVVTRAEADEAFDTSRLRGGLSDAHHDTDEDPERRADVWQQLLDHHPDESGIR